MLFYVIVEFENAETLLISEVQMLLEHRYTVKYVKVDTIMKVVFLIAHCFSYVIVCHVDLYNIMLVLLAVCFCYMLLT